MLLLQLDDDSMKDINYPLNALIHICKTEMCDYTSRIDTFYFLKMLMYLKLSLSSLLRLSLQWQFSLLGNLSQVLPPSQNESAVSHDADAS